MSWLLYIARLLELHVGLHELSVPAYTALHCSAAPVTGARWQTGAQKHGPGVHHRQGVEREDPTGSCGDLACVKYMYLEAGGELSLIRMDEARDAV